MSTIVLRFLCCLFSSVLPKASCSPQVQSITERVIVFLLSQVVERSSQEKVLFSLHPPTESCKLLWRDSQAVGFYTVKHKEINATRCYLLPALDTVLVRRSWRRRGLGLQMLEDYCSSFYTETCLGISSPLSPSMAAVCRSFLQQHKEHLEQLYEVEAPGDWTQRRNIWLGIQLGRYSLGDGEENSPTSGEMQKNEGDDSSQKTLPVIQAEDEAPRAGRSLEQDVLQPTLMVCTLDPPADHHRPGPLYLQSHAERKHRDVPN
ncbi:hypothetical protein FQN60_014610, partial [Etheostoma spectabile]